MPEADVIITNHVLSMVIGEGVDTSKDSKRSLKWPGRKMQVRVTAVASRDAGRSCEGDRQKSGKP